MRLTPTQITAIREVVHDQCGPESRVRLFGSRLDDTQRGGDVDLFVELDQPIERPAVLSASNPSSKPHTLYWVTTLG